MIGLLSLLLALWTAPFKSWGRLEAENVVLRHQLIVLRRNLRGQVRLTNSDRWFFVQSHRWYPFILNALTIIQPETLVRWHRVGFRVEVASTGRAPADRHGLTHADPADERREPALGRAAYPRRTAQARI